MNYFLDNNQGNEHWQKSDSMICNTKAHNTFQHKKQNDLIFYNAISDKIGIPMRDVDSELLLWKGRDPRECSLTSSVTSRGGNAKTCDTNICQGYTCFQPAYLDEFLLEPCKENTFRNHIVCDETKCCSLRHQLFMNITKRR